MVQLLKMCPKGQDSALCPGEPCNCCPKSSLHFPIITSENSVHMDSRASHGGELHNSPTLTLEELLTALPCLSCSLHCGVTVHPRPSAGALQRAVSSPACSLCCGRTVSVPWPDAHKPRLFREELALLSAAACKVLLAFFLGAR